MRVLWVNEVVELQGGCERYIRDLAMQLGDRGIDSYLFYDALRPPQTREMLQAFSGAFPMVDTARQVAELKPDIIYLHRLDDARDLSPFLNSGVPVARFYHDHDLFCLRRHKYTTIGQKTCTRPIGPHCYPCLGFINRADGVTGVTFRSVGRLRRLHRAQRPLAAHITASDYMANHLAAHGFDRQKTHVIPLFAAPPEHNLPELPREPDLLLFVGQLLRGKGLDILLHAMTKMQHAVRLDVLGEGRQGSEWRALASDLGLDSRVRFLGRVPQTALADYYRRAACVVMPNRQPETFGLVGPEAMRFGTPVVATDAGGVSQWLQHERTGLLTPPNDPAALAQALDRLVSNPAAARAWGDAGRVRWEAEFQPDRHVRGLMNVFEKILGNDAAHPELLAVNELEDNAGPVAPMGAWAGERHK